MPPTDPDVPNLEELAALNGLLQHRVRLAICVLLSKYDVMSFSRLKDVLEEKDGSLGTHLRKLEDAGYLAIDKDLPRPAPGDLVPTDHCWPTASGAPHREPDPPDRAGRGDIDGRSMVDTVPCPVFGWSHDCLSLSCGASLCTATLIVGRALWCADSTCLPSR